MKEIEEIKKHAEALSEIAAIVGAFSVYVGDTGTISVFGCPEAKIDLFKNDRFGWVDLND